MPGKTVDVCLSRRPVSAAARVHQCAACIAIAAVIGPASVCAAGDLRAIVRVGAASNNSTFTDHLTSLNTTHWTVSDGGANGSWMLNNWRASQIVFNRSGLFSTFNLAAPGSSERF